MKRTEWTIVLVAGYLLCQIVADVTAVKMIGPIFGQFMPAAVFIYSLTFTWRDLVHRQLGKREAITLVWTAGVVNIAMALYFMFTMALPPAPFWPHDEAYKLILGVVPRIVVASIVAELVSELVDTEVYHILFDSPRWFGVLASNAAGLVLDSFIFCTLAFALTMPWSAVLAVVKGQILAKAAITLLSIPLIYAVRTKNLHQLGTE